MSASLGGPASPIASVAAPSSGQKRSCSYRLPQRGQKRMEFSVPSLACSSDDVPVNVPGTRTCSSDDVPVNVPVPVPVHDPTLSLRRPSTLETKDRDDERSRTGTGTGTGTRTTQTRLPFEP